ncbi:MAG TPA: hypothetical protein GXX73_00830 [Clostridium sp.]|nr:hypothetical protein [Clostridium sp.]
MTYLQDLFIAIVNMSITASYVAIGVILLRFLFKKVPKIFSYILWTPVLFRLVCPFSINSVFSFFNLITLNVKQGSRVYEFVPQNIWLNETPSVGNIDNAVNAPLPGTVLSESVNPMQIWITVSSLIWIFGVIVLTIYSFSSYMKIKGKLQTATLVEGNVFETDAISTAFVCGFIRPRIYVPTNIGDANLSYILEHERTHIRRKDYLIKPIAFLALILHWFNPLMWLSFALMSRDMEMSCDESVMYRLGEGAKGGYSNSLLSLSVRRKGILTAAPLAFGESYVKTRIKNVLNFKKPKFWVIMVAVMAVLAASIAFATNASKEGKILVKDRRKVLEVNDEYNLKADPTNKGELQSDLNDAIYNKYDFMNVDDETVSTFTPMPDEMRDEEQKAFQVLQEYFAAFELADYDAMCILSTENHNNNFVDDGKGNFIHDGDVWGMRWAKAKKIELIRDTHFLRIENSDSVLVFNVSVDMETVKTSAQYLSTQTSFYVVLLKGDDGRWRVDRYETG